ncbi:MAG: S-methyl-5'-thioadenosine phosphorylase [Vulcanococcus sp.]|jgi:5'-methylthioadenosine phosphorylase|uniref:S-methyl-5'-thioadenosine phosphorylase n=1 Tax=Vulcanococcus sp. TaxID=2856995 RepID=UPI0025DFBF8B|nr:S-methyl-5'-thioadenosine phosphorylase [Vulcanococcus sp.]MBW0173244.1 S-methyl-5'-thioadenosine phosphorylase [Vulcanococcus sp.]MBW0181610.1 S-methyl-5'-thioadenosine phosphorylase [Vulcanococcus sp.]
MASPTGLNLAQARLGVLGGSGLYAMEGLENVQELTIDTPFGPPSDSLRLGTLGGMEVVFLARHGRHHTYLPTEVPYRANIWAMRSLGVRWILSPSAVGSLQEQVKPLDMVVPDQFIDRTMQRPISFFGEGAVAHVALADPFCPSLSRLLGDVADSLMPEGHSLHRGGTYLCMEGPAFSTRAESNLYRSWGCTVIGMTNHTEARLAREAEIAYATLAMATDYDCWYADHDSVTVEMVIGNLRANAELATQIVRTTAERIGVQRPASQAHTALRDALMTPADQVPAATRRKLDLLTEPYWGSFKG